LSKVLCCTLLRTSGRNIKTYMGPVFAYINILRRLCYCAFMHAHFSITKICDARPAVTFLAAEHHRPSISTKLYCLVTEAGVRERLDYGRTRQRSG